MVPAGDHPREVSTPSLNPKYQWSEFYHRWVAPNSLSDDFIPESLALLRPGGHFLEIGKRGIWSTDRMHAARPGWSGTAEESGTSKGGWANSVME